LSAAASPMSHRPTLYQALPETRKPAKSPQRLVPRSSAPRAINVEKRRRSRVSPAPNPFSTLGQSPFSQERQPVCFWSCRQMRELVLKRCSRPQRVETKYASADAPGGAGTPFPFLSRGVRPPKQRRHEDRHRRSRNIGTHPRATARGAWSRDRDFHLPATAVASQPETAKIPCPWVEPGRHDRLPSTFCLTRPRCKPIRGLVNQAGQQSAINNVRRPAPAQPVLSPDFSELSPTVFGAEASRPNDTQQPR